MRPSLTRKCFAAWLGLLLSVSSGLGESARAADLPRVSIGEVVVAPSASAGEQSRELTRALRSTLTDELTKAGLGKVKRSVIVSATLTRLSSETSDARVKTSAVISLAVRRADDQVLFAELRGRASVEETTKNLAWLRQRALEGAVRGALARLPEAVERAR